jgi:hypothetical protein
MVRIWPTNNVHATSIKAHLFERKNFEIIFSAGETKEMTLANCHAVCSNQRLHMRTLAKRKDVTSRMRPELLRNKGSRRVLFGGGGVIQCSLAEVYDVSGEHTTTIFRNVYYSTLRHSS